MGRICALLILLAGLGCLPAGTLAGGMAGHDAGVVFSALEQRLLASATVRLDYHAHSEGAFESDIHGQLRFAADGGVELIGSGSFGGRPVDLLIRAAGQNYEFGNGAQRVSAPLPAHLREALVVGFMRMGILHNLARLSESVAPDHADGGAREWVVANAFGVDPANAAAITFDVVVSGTRAGTASLEFDTRGLPLVRRQTVQFPDGEMRVVERYSALAIEP